MAFGLVTHYNDFGQKSKTIREALHRVMNGRAC